MKKSLRGDIEMRRQEYIKRELLKYVGNTSQVFGIKDYCLNGGKADKVRAVDLKNGTGMELTVLPDRGLDIAYLGFKGVNFSYMSSTGIAAPQYFNVSGSGFHRNFYGGFLTTCGTTYAGASCKDNGEELGPHGLISNIPAEEVYAGTEWVDGSPVLKVKGKLREARFFGENIIMSREISINCGENKISIKDTVENNGFRSEPLMILYHFNLGYPLLTDKSYLILPSANVAPRDKEVEKGIGEYKFFQYPTPEYKEQVFYHDLKTDDTGRTFAALINPGEQAGVAIRFNKNQLCRFTQWKQMGEGEYVLGLEPCNCHVEGRAKAREDGTLQFIKPGEIRNFEIEIEIIDGMDEINQIQMCAEKY
jgi:hypothetical protein